MRHTILLLLAASVWGGQAQAADLFPLNPGAVWEYRADGVQEPFVIQVGLNQLFVFSDNRVYSRLTGYVAEPLWVRLNESGDLVYLDEESGQESMLTALDVHYEDWSPAPFRRCQQESQAHSDAVPYSGPTGFISSTVAVRYRSYSCADVGVETEQFAANVGMVSRTVSTIAGPVVYKLIYANTGSVHVAPRGAATFRLALEHNDDRSITARLRFSADPDAAPTFVFGTSQELDMVLRDSSGRSVWKWSDGQVFSTALHQRQASNLAYEVTIPSEIAGQVLPGGNYTVEAWLTTTAPDSNPRVTASIHIPPAQDVEQTTRPMRSRVQR